MAKVFLEYSFLFDPDTTWDSLSSFEKDLADFFAAHSLEAEIIKTVEGQLGRRILWIKKLDIFDKMIIGKTEPQKGIQEKMKELTPNSPLPTQKKKVQPIYRFLNKKGFVKL